jgi:hypothetical protein
MSIYVESLVFLWRNPLHGMIVSWPSFNQRVSGYRPAQHNWNYTIVLAFRSAYSKARWFLICSFQHVFELFARKQWQSPFSRLRCVSSSVPYFTPIHCHFLKQHSQPFFFNAQFSITCFSFTCFVCPLLPRLPSLSSHLAKMRKRRA